MRLSVILVSTTLFLSACAGDPVENQRKANEHSDNVIYARTHFDKKKKDECITDFKEHMNDPSSFQLASDFVELPDPTHVPDPNIVQYLAQVRGKNAYGGLILTRLGCDFWVDSKSGTMRVNRTSSF